MPLLRKSQQLLTRFESLRFLASSSSGGRPRPRPAASRPAPAPSTALQQAQEALPPAAAGNDWTEVVHQQTGLTYYWNQRTGETTALGEPKPGAEGRVQQPRRAVQPGTSLVGLVGVGAGVGLVFALLSRIL